MATKRSSDSSRFEDVSKTSDDYFVSSFLDWRTAAALKKFVVHNELDERVFNRALTYTEVSRLNLLHRGIEVQTSRGKK